MEALHLVCILAFGLMMLAGSVLILIAAFSESVVWGVLCLFVPAAGLVFVIRHWERARSGAILWFLGGAGFLVTSLTWTPKAKGVTPTHASAAPTSVAVKCPPATATDGFVKWCCDGSAWSEAARGSDCDTAFRPTESCDATTAGTLSTTACSSAPSTGKKRRR